MGFKRILILNIKIFFNNMNSFELKNPNEKFFQVLFFYGFWVTILILLFKFISDIRVQTSYSLIEIITMSIILRF